jgi:hypothetical protein
MKELIFIFFYFLSIENVYWSVENTGGKEYDVNPTLLKREKSVEREILVQKKARKPSGEKTNHRIIMKLLQ